MASDEIERLGAPVAKPTTPHPDAAPNHGPVPAREGGLRSGRPSPINFALGRIIVGGLFSLISLFGRPNDMAMSIRQNE